MKEEIIKLRNEGLSYFEISKRLNCSKSTVCYHLNDRAKQKNYKRTREHMYLKLFKKMDNFKIKSKITQKIRIKTSHFNNKDININIPQFSYHDVIDKFGIETVCYLTGRPINLITDDYHFDHIIPVCQGGDSSLANLGIACKEANLAKSGLNVTEFLNLCKEILEYNGYTVK